MRPAIPLRAVLAAAAASAAFLGSAHAQMRAAPVWTPPFAPVTAGVLGGIQSLLGTPAGLKLAAELSSVQAIGSYSAASDVDLRVVGAMSAHLPADFEALLAAAKKDPAAAAAAARALGEAYRAAVPAVSEAVESRAKQVAAAVAYGQLEGRDIVIAANQLDRFGLYGQSVKDKAGVVRRMASQNIMENAQRVAADFLRAQRRPEAGPSSAKEEGKRKPIPEAWKLHAYQKAAGGTAAARAKPAPPEPEPKAKPMSADLYERLGARKGMKAEELKAAFERTAELYRPERYLDRDTRSLIALTMAYRKIEDAFAVLGDPAQRAAYDQGKLPKEGAAPNPLAEDYYERIGATKAMSQDELKKAYRRAAAAFHPDKAQNKGTALVEAMTKAFQDIGEAYETLGDPAKRAAYDRRPAPRR